MGLLVLLGCPLPGNVLYRCDEGDTCALEGLTCAADGFCHPSAEVLEDGGLVSPDGGGCIPRDLTAACAAVECGFVNDGCGVEQDCRRDCPAPQECGVKDANRCAIPSLCTPEGWCWENPLPQGFTIAASLRVDARHTWFVGENRLVLFSDGERSYLQEPPAPPGVDLLGIHGTAPDDVFVVGNSGVILHFDGTRWQREGTLSPFINQLRTVWSFGDGGALAAGPGGRLLSRAALVDPFSRWTLETFPSTEDIRDVFADSSGGVYAVTRRNELFTRPQGSTSNWTLLDTVPLQETWAGMARGDGLTFGGVNVNRANLVHRDPDGGWRQLTDAGFATLEFAPGDGGVFALSNGSEFAWLSDTDEYTRFVVQPGQWNTGVALPGPRLLLGGLSGAMAVSALDGGLTWRSSGRVQRGHSLNAVCGYAPGAMFAVGGIDNSAACANCRVRWLERQVTTSGVSWTSKDFQLGSTTQLLTCYAEDADHVWFPGNDSKFVYLDAGQPFYGDFGGGPLYGQYSGAWGNADAGYFFTRREAREVTTSPDGFNAFALSDTLAPGGLRSVWGFGRDDVLVAGLNGATSHFDGVTWTAESVGNIDFAAVHGAQLAGGERRYVAVGNAGALLSVVGDAGVLTQVSNAVSFSGTWVSPRGRAWAVGRASDGGAFVMNSEAAGAWVLVPLTSPRPVTGVFGFDETIWVTGSQGMILRRGE